MKYAPKITVAISVYNVAEYLPKCLDCVVNQTFKDIEILCIDDCSTDETYSILQRYASEDDRFRLIKQSHNQGLSVSRNTAIANACGEYIWMLDGDDLFETDLLEKAYTVATRSNADVTIWDYHVFESDSDLNDKSAIRTRLENINETDHKSLLKLPSFMWIRLYRLDYLRRLNVYFTPGLTKQDIPVNWKTLTHKPKVTIVPDVLAYYRMRASSTTNRKGKSLFSLYKVMDIVGDNLQADGLYREFFDEYMTSRLQLLHGMYDFILPELKEEAMSVVKEKCREKDVCDFLQTKSRLLSRRTRLFYKMLNGNLPAQLQYKAFIVIRKIYRFIKR